MSSATSVCLCLCLRGSSSVTGDPGPSQIRTQIWTMLRLSRSEADLGQLGGPDQDRRTTPSAPTTERERQIIVRIRDGCVGARPDVRRTGVRPAVGKPPKRLPRQIRDGESSSESGPWCVDGWPKFRSAECWGGHVRTPTVDVLPEGPRGPPSCGYQGEPREQCGDRLHRCPCSVAAPQMALPARRALLGHVEQGEELSGRRFPSLGTPGAPFRSGVGGPRSPPQRRNARNGVEQVAGLGASEQLDLSRLVLSAPACPLRRLIVVAQAQHVHMGQQSRQSPASSANLDQGH